MMGRWVEPDQRDEVVDYVHRFFTETGVSRNKIVCWLGIPRSKYYEWCKRYGTLNQHNGKKPRHFWLEEWEREAIREYFKLHPFVGYRRLSYMMIDADVVAASPSTVYRVLDEAGLLERTTWAKSKKGTGFDQPKGPHCDWHTDITHVWAGGVCYNLTCVLDGYSRYILGWTLTETMTSEQMELFIQRVREQYPETHAKLISDNGPQFIAKEFANFIKGTGMRHWRTSAYYPQSNGKQERVHGTIKTECLRRKCPQTMEEAEAVLTTYIREYNGERLHSAIGYVTPKDMLEGRQAAIHAERDRKLEAARERRKEARHEAA